MHINDLEQDYIQVTADGTVMVLNTDQQRKLFDHIFTRHKDWVTRDDISDPYCAVSRERGK